MTECYDFTYLLLIMFEVYFLIFVMKSAKHLKQQINTEIHMLAANLASSMSNLICSLSSPTPCFGGNFICYQNTYFKEIAESSHSIPKSVNVNLQKRFSHITTMPFTYKQFIMCNPRPQLHFQNYQNYFCSCLLKQRSGPCLAVTALQKNL